MTLSRRHRSSFCVRRSALPGALAAITACFAAPAISHASPITYELSGATATFTSPIGTLTLTGDFVFDPVTSTFDSVSITATGPMTILDTSPETFDVVLLGGLRFLAARDTGPVPPVTITLRFVDAVGGLSPNPIVGFDIGNSIDLTTAAVTGDAVPLPVPESSTWAMMLLGFAGLVVAGYRASRKNVALAA